MSIGCEVVEVAYWHGYGDGGLMLSGCPAPEMFGNRFEQLFDTHEHWVEHRSVVVLSYYEGYEEGFMNGYIDGFIETQESREET